MPCSHVKMHGLKNGQNDSDANPDEDFESELSPMERKTHLSAIGSGSASGMVDVSANSSGINFMHKSDQEIRSNLDLSIENCSTSGKKSSKEELNRCYKNIRSHKISKAFLPHWVYRMYDSYWLAQRAAGSFTFLLLTLFDIIFSAFSPSLLWHHCYGLTTLCFSFGCWSFIIDFKIQTKILMENLCAIITWMSEMVMWTVEYAIWSMLLFIYYLLNIVNFNEISDNNIIFISNIGLLLWNECYS